MKTTQAQMEDFFLTNRMSCTRCGVCTSLWCLGCERVQYCGVVCQNADWSAHQLACTRSDIGAGHLAELFANQPYSQDIFWEILSKKEITLVDLMFDLGDDSDATQAWYETRNRILDWLLSPRNTGRIARLWRIPPRALREQLVLFAARYGFVSLLQELLNRGLDGSVQTNAAIVWASANGHAGAVQALLMDPRVDPSAQQNEAIARASEKGHADVVQVLMSDPRVDPSDQRNRAFEAALRWFWWNRPEYVTIIQRLLEDPRVDTLENVNEVFQKAVDGSLTDIARALLADPRVDPAANKNIAIQEAKTPDMVRLLLADLRVDPAADNNNAIREASLRGRADVVRLLLADPRVNPADKDNDAIIMSTQEYDGEVTRILLDDVRVDPSAKNNWAIRRAADRNNINVVRLLLADPRVDPTASDNDAVKSAIENDNLQTVQVLLADPRVRATFSKQDAQKALEKGYRGYRAEDRVLSLELRRLLDDYIRGIQRGHPLDDESEPPVKMIKERLLRNK